MELKNIKQNVNCQIIYKINKSAGRVYNPINYIYKKKVNSYKVSAQCLRCVCYSLLTQQATYSHVHALNLILCSNKMGNFWLL